MSVRPIRLLGDPVLTSAAAPVTTFDAELRHLIRDLHDTLADADGAGLAAPQLGVGLRVFVYQVLGDEPGHLVNPVLSRPTEEDQDGPEGCLSIPGVTLECVRWMDVVARGQNEFGDPVEVTGSARLARCFQHETDHLDGVLFLDRLDPARRKAAMAEIRESAWFGLVPPPVRVSPHPVSPRLA